MKNKITRQQFIDRASAMGDLDDDHEVVRCDAGCSYPDCQGWRIELTSAALAKRMRQVDAEIDALLNPRKATDALEKPTAQRSALPPLW